MGNEFEELDFRRTAFGELILRRRLEPRLNDKEIFEVKLGDEFLMTSLVTVGETAVAELALAELPLVESGTLELDVLVGGLGLGYTASAALRHPSVRSVLVIEALNEVIDWHRRGLVPLADELMSDGRCKIMQGDFFALMTASGRESGHRFGGQNFHAVLVDIDHSPRHLLHPRNHAFYEPMGLRSVETVLHPGGVFALWSNDAPDDEFEKTLDTVFASSRAHLVRFPNPYTSTESASTVYLARTDAHGP